MCLSFVIGNYLIIIFMYSPLLFGVGLTLKIACLAARVSLDFRLPYARYIPLYARTLF